MVLCGTWSETSVAQSQLTQFWQIPRQNAFLFTVNAIFLHDYPLAVEPGSTPRPLVHKKLGEILYLLICSFLPYLSWLLRSRVRKSRRDLWITLYSCSYPMVTLYGICNAISLNKGLVILHQYSSKCVWSGYTGCFSVTWCSLLLLLLLLLLITHHWDTQHANR